jgi:hypothetical protein
MDDTVVLTRRGPNNGKGRPVGALNRTTRDLKEFWHYFFSSHEYREKAKERILNGTAPHLESYLLNRIYGKPTERIAVSVDEPQQDLSRLSIEELEAMAQGLLHDITEAKEIRAALPAEFRPVQSATSEETLISPTDSPAESAPNLEER